MIGRLIVKSSQNFKSKIVLPIKYWIKPKQFTFIDLPEQNKNGYKQLSYEEWKTFKDQKKQMNRFYYFSYFLIAFFLGDWIYSLKNNQNVMYYYYVRYLVLSYVCRYPLFMKMNQSILLEFQQTFGPFFDIVPKQKYQMALVWSRLGDLVFKTNKKEEIKKEKVEKLKGQMKQLDSKLMGK